MTGVPLTLRWRSAGILAGVRRPPRAWMRLMQPEENLDLANGLHLRVLVRDDAGLLVEATSEGQDPALWGPRPAEPYSLRDAQAALSAWDPAAGGQFSIGI